MKSSRSLSLIFPWLAGFFLSVNLYMVPSASASPRITDLIGAGLGLWVIYRLSRGRLSILPLAFTVSAMLFPLAWLVASYFSGDRATMVQAARWILAVPWALALHQILKKDSGTNQLAWGLVWGAAVNLVVILMQEAGLESTLRMVGLSSTDAAYYYRAGMALRIPGLHGHHSASSAVMSLIIPAAMYLYLRGRTRVFIVFASLAILMVGLNYTSTRSPLVITAFTLLFAMFVARRLDKIMGIAALVVVLIIPVVVVIGPPGGWTRWTNQQAVSSNAHERLGSNIGAMALIIKRPWGYGVREGAQVLADLTSQSATHNAYLEAGLVFGLPFGLLVLTAILRSALGCLRGPTQTRFLTGLLAFHFGGLAMFEEHLNNPTFIILVTWLIVQLMWNPAAKAAPSVSGSPVPQD